jgi:hypothetical protein
MHVLAAVLEDFFVSLDRSELLSVYSRSLQAWGPYISRTELNRLTALVRQISSDGIAQLFPTANQPRPPGLKIPTELLNVSVRASNCLLKCGIANVHELALSSPDLLMKVGCLGRKTLSEFAEVLEEYFNGLEPSMRVIYDQSYNLWKGHFADDLSSARSSGVVRIRRPNPESKPVSEIGFQTPAALDDERQFPGLHVPVGDLLVSVRASGCLERAGIANLHELAVTLPSSLLNVKNLGRRTLKELARIVDAYFSALESSLKRPYETSYSAWRAYLLPGSGTEPAEPSSVMHLVTRFLAAQSERNREILIRRFGLRTATRRQTLDAIGRSVGLTRERIRQIVVKLHGRLAANLRRAWPDLMSHLREHLDRVGLAAIPEIVSLIPNLGEPAEYSFDASIHLILSSFAGIHAVGSQTQLWSTDTSINGDFYREVIKEGKAILRRTSADLQNLALEIARRLHRGEDVEAIRVIIQHAPSVFAVRSSDQHVGLLEGQSIQHQRRLFAYEYIREQGVPITLSEVFEAMRETEPDILPDSPTARSVMHNLSSLIERDDRFSWAGPGTWGLREWGYDACVTSIAQAARCLLMRAGPMTTAQIQETLSQLYRVSPSSITAALNSERGKTVTKDSDGHWVAYQ